MSTPSIARDLRLKPQARAVLAHLKTGESLSPLEAWAVYGNMRLAASICELRRAGYKVLSQHKRDQRGHNYTRYTLEMK